MSTADPFVAIKSKIARVATLLGGHVKHAPHESNYYWRSEIYFDGHKLVTSSREHESKIEIFYCQPKCKLDYANDYASSKLFDAIGKTINVSQAKTAEQIAKDIRRRFDWDAIAEALRVQEQIEIDTLELKRKHDAIVSRVAEITGAKQCRTNRPLEAELRTESGIEFKVCYLKIDVSFTLDCDIDSEPPQDWQKALTVLSLSLSDI